MQDYSLPEESDNGNAEYKYYIQPASTDRFDRLVTQLRWRLNEGDGSCLYELGVLDDGTVEGIPMSRMRESLSYLCAMAQTLGAQVTLRRLLYRQGASLHAVQSQEEARKELQLDQGLPYASILQSTPHSDMLRIDLMPWAPHRVTSALHSRTSHSGINGHESSTSSNEDTPSATVASATNTQPPQRRTLRLARFEAAIHEGAGCTQKTVLYRHHGPLRQPHSPDEFTRRWCAELTVQHEECFFVDYSSLRP